MSEQSADIDLLAAALRADGGDLAVYLNVLATKLEDSCPELTTVERRRAGLLSRERKVTRVTVEMGDQRFTLEAAPGGVRASCAKVVRGIVLDRDQPSLDEWVTALAAALARLAEETAQGREALKALLS
jgi:hypothetical protein